VNNVPLSKKKSTLKLELKHSAISIKCWSIMLSSTCFCCFPPCYCNPQLEIHNGIFCFSSFNMCGLFLCTLSFKPPKKQKSSGIRYGDWGGHTFWEIMLLPKDLCDICICYRPFLLKLVELFITFQQGNEIHNLFVVKFCSYCSSGAKGADYSPFRDTTPWSSDF